MHVSVKRVSVFLWGTIESDVQKRASRLPFLYDAGVGCNQMCSGSHILHIFLWKRWKVTPKWMKHTTCLMLTCTQCTENSTNCDLYKLLKPLQYKQLKDLLKSLWLFTSSLDFIIVATRFCGRDSMSKIFNYLGVLAHDYTTDSNSRVDMAAQLLVCQIGRMVSII